MIFTPFQLFKRKIVFSILLTGMVFACNAPEDLIEEKNPSNAKVTILRKAEIENKKMLFTKISKMKQNFVNSKTVTSTAYQFSIDTNMCKMVEVNGITTYTFAVTREQPNGFFENLVVKENNDGSYSAYLLQYNISEAEKQQLLNGVDIDLNNRINKIAITDTDFISDITSKVYYNPNACYDVSIVTVPSRSCPENHTSPDDCKYADPNSPLYDPSLMPIIGYSTLVYTEIDCPTSGGGGGSTGTSDPALGGGTSPTGGGNGGNNTITDPCVFLKALIQKQEIKQILNNLKNKLNINKESGYTFNVDNTTFTSIPSTETTETETKLNATTYTFGAAHTHQNGVVPVPTPGDLSIIFFSASHYQQPTTNYNFDDNYFNFVVSNDGYTYILLPNDLQTFSNNADLFSENMGELNEMFRDDFTEIGDDSLKLASALLNILNVKNNYNVSLYRIPTNNGLYDGQWNKLEINNNELEGDYAKEKPCPN